MSKILTLVLIMGLVFGLTGCIGPDGNRPPYTPSVNLPSEAEVNEEVKIAVRSVDPDRDELTYRIRFGDGDEAWSEQHESGEEVTFKYKWTKTGDYGVKTRAYDGKTVSEWSEIKWIRIKTSHPQRKMSVLWCGDENWAELMGGMSDAAIKTLHRDAAETWDVGYGGTHIVGFHEPCRPDWYEGTKVKLISYLKYYSLDEIRGYARRWKDHPNHGGYWMIEGHEPDITGGSMHEPGTVEAHKQLRIAQYNAIREIDPDAWNHPVVIWYNCTGAFSCYPGWQNAFPTPEEGIDCDIYAADIYANACDGTTNYEGLARAANDLVTIGMERSKEQFIPCLGAFVNPGCQAVTPLEQFEWWQEWYRNQTGEELRSVAFYFSGLGSTAEGVYENEVLQEGAREINRRLGLLE